MTSDSSDQPPAPEPHAAGLPTVAEELRVIMRDQPAVFLKIEEAAVDATFMWDLDDPTRHFVSPRFWSILGYDADAIPPDGDWQGVADPKDLAAFHTAIEAHASCDGPEIEQRIRLRHAHGYEILTETYALTVCHRSNGPNRVIGIHRDLSRERQLEILLNETNTAARIGAWSWDVASGKIYWSPVTKLIHGVDDPDYQPVLDTAIEFYREGYSRELIQVVIAACLKEGTPWDELCEIVTAKGEFRWVRVIGHAERFRGENVRLLGSFQDIHEQRLRDLELAKSEALLSNSFKLIPSGMLILDAEGRVERVSASFSRLIGYAPHEIIGQAFTDFTHPDGREADAAMFDALEDTERPQFRSEKRYVDAAGKNLWVDVAVAAIRNDQDEISNYLAQVIDVTNAKSEEAYRVHLAFLEDKAREMEQFAYIASHDLRQPVLTLKGYLGALREDYDAKLDDAGREYVTIMESAVERMDLMIRGLLDYSRLSKSRQLEEVNLDEVLKGVLDDIEALRLETGGEIEAGGMPVVYGRHIELTQVFQNLLANALKYHRRGVAPRVEITCRAISGGYEFCVLDNGIGISDSDQDRIFGLFQRVGEGAHDTTGSGIGLASCKTIVERHGGSIKVSSTLGEGSRFCFTILTEQFQ